MANCTVLDNISINFTLFIGFCIVELIFTTSLQSPATGVVWVFCTNLLTEFIIGDRLLIVKLIFWSEIICEIGKELGFERSCLEVGSEKQMVKGNELDNVLFGGYHRPP